MLIVFGSLNIDHIMQAPHLPAPGETVGNGVYKQDFGGKGGNQAIAAARSLDSVSVAFVGAVGKDISGNMYLDRLKSQDIRIITSRSNQATGTAFVVVSQEEGAENQIVVAPGANSDAKAAIIQAASPDEDTILLMQMEVPLGENAKAIDAVKAAGGRAVLNLAPYAAVSGEILNKLDFLVLNEGEAAALAADNQLVGGKSAHPRALAHYLSEEYGLACIITLGENGCVCASEGEVRNHSSITVNAVDTTGAGDAFCGAFAAAIEQKLSLEESIQRGMAAGALACTALGAQSALPRQKQIDAIIPRLR